MNRDASLNIRLSQARKDLLENDAKSNYRSITQHILMIIDQYYKEQSKGYIAYEVLKELGNLDIDPRKHYTSAVGAKQIREAFNKIEKDHD